MLDFSELERNGIPIIHRTLMDEELTKLGDRRKLLLSLIRDDGWVWDDLKAGSYTHEM
jgi:hypothetical protein